MTDGVRNDSVGPKRLIVCARVSTEEQSKRGVSVSQQLEAGRKKAAEVGAIVVGHCIEAGVSGALYESRADLQEALGKVEAREADGLIWYDLSRMSRDIEYIQVIRRRVERAGGQIVFVTTDYGNNSAGFLHQGIDSVVHQYQRMQTREVAQVNRRKAVLAGRQTQRSTAPYGYKVINRDDVVRGTHTTEQLGKYEIVPDEAEVVRLIFDLYAAGNSTRAICRLLAERAIPTPKRSRAKANADAKASGDTQADTGGREWLRSTIKTILSNPCHYGRASFGKTRRAHDEGRIAKGFRRDFRYERVPPSEWLYIDCPAIVTRELWEACNARLSEAKTLQAGAPERKYMLTGLLRCPACRRTMGAARKRRPFDAEDEKQIFYYCKYSSSARARAGAGAICAKKTYKGRDLEEAVVVAVEAITTSPDRLEAAYHDYQNQIDRLYNSDERQRIERELADVEKTIQSAVLAQVDAVGKGIDTSVYEELLRTKSLQRSALRDALAVFEAKRARAIDPTRPAGQQSQQIAAIAAAVVEALRAPEITPPERQRALTRIVEAVYPTEGGKGEGGGVRVIFRGGVFDPRLKWVYDAGAWRVSEGEDT